MALRWILLCPTLANIFVDYREMKFFTNIPMPLLHFRYVDDTFAAFDSEED